MHTVESALYWKTEPILYGHLIALGRRSKRIPKAERQKWYVREPKQKSIYDPKVMKHIDRVFSETYRHPIVKYDSERSWRKSRTITIRVPLNEQFNARIKRFHIVQ